MGDFDLVFIKGAIVVVLVAIISGAASCNYTKHTLNEMVKNGANPIDAACAIGIETGPTPIECILRGAKIEKNNEE